MKLYVFLEYVIHKSMQDYPERESMLPDSTTKKLVKLRWMSSCKIKKETSD